MYPELMSRARTHIEEEFGSLLDKVPILNNRTNVSELSGGITNKNIRVTTPNQDFVVRISSNSSELLSIDRDAEFVNTSIASDIGIGAKVYEYLPEQGLLVIGFIEGKTLSAADVSNNLARVAKSCRQLHSARPFSRNFDMFAIRDAYLKTVLERGFKLPPRYLEFESHLNKMQQALAVLDDGVVPCNNDLLPANFIDDGEKIWLIDYEYSGNNDACFELGNIWAEAKLEPYQLEELVNHYYLGPRPEKVARAWLYALLARYGWTLWASIQNSISEIDFDFWSWGMEKYERAEEDFLSQDFLHNLEVASVNH
jgi:thiamine kinase-like enzyme